MKERYMFVSQHTQEWPVQVVCQVLQLSRSAYYSWLSATSKSSNQKQNQVHTAIIETFQQHRRRYGVRRIVAELQRYRRRFLPSPPGNAKERA